MRILKSTIRNINGEYVEIEVIRYFKNNDIEYNEEDLKLYCKEGLKTINKKIVS